ncbi:MAG TPA: gas vesicle protein GvpO [Nitriliruptorales bacterium]|nr:gas vesicle protein GvpO [Nitriliruptorales bacterium]
MADDESAVQEDREEPSEPGADVSENEEEPVAPHEEEGKDGHDGNDDGPSAGGTSPLRLREVVARIRDDFAEVTGLEVDRVTALTRGDDGWRVRIDVVEVPRVPHSTDVLATYEVRADGDGSMGSFERVRRFHRSQADDG